MKIYANVIFRNLKLIDAFVKVKQIYKQNEGTYGLVGVSQNEETANKGSFLYDFVVGPVNNESEIVSFILNKFEKDNIQARTVAEPTDISSAESTVESTKDVVEKPKRTRKKKVDA